MRIFLAAAAGLAIAATASAQQPWFALTTDDCTTVVDNAAERSELYMFKVANTGGYTDILFNMTNTGGLSAGGATTGDAVNQQWNVPPNWRNGQLGTDVAFAVMTYPPAAGSTAGRIMIDSGNLSSQDMGAAARQVVGNSLPVAYAGTASVGIQLSGSSAPYSVKLRGPASPTVNFPFNAAQAVEVAFAPVVEVNTVDPSGSGFCAIAGDFSNPDTSVATGNPNGGLTGILLGYNVYRLAGTAGTVPTVDQFYTASIDADPTTGWQYFMPLTSSFNLGTADTNPGGANLATAPTDTNPNDLGGLQNPDGVMYSGDEVMVFQDSGTVGRTGRNTGSAPAAGTSYWYAFQPVANGAVSDFGPNLGFANGSSTTTGGGTLPGEHRVDTNVDGVMDSVNLDLDAAPKVEFFSPQANGAAPQRGLGLTWNGRPLLSAPVFGAIAPAAAHGRTTLSATVSGSDVNITFQTGMESGDVRGFNVYRVVGDSQTRINDQLILAQGNESNVYRVVDDATQARRLAKGGVFQYSVEIVHADGTTQMVGPFDVTLERTAPARRHR